MIVSRSPYSNKVADTYSYQTDARVRKQLEASFAFSDEYAQRSFEFRRKALMGVASNLRANKYELSELITNEMGKLVSESLSEIEKCAWVCEYYASNAEDFLKNERIESDAVRSEVAYRPMGVVLGVMPWNFPFWQVFRFAAPAVMAGNVVLLKHSSIVPRCAEEIERLFMDSTFAGPILSNLFITKEQVSALISDARVSAVTLTGSEQAGRAVAAKAGESLKKTVLELGGSDPYIVLKDADLESAVDVCATARMMNAGQSCIGAKRFIIESEIYDDFITRFRDRMDSYSFGDPMNNKSDLAPLASMEQRERLHQQVLNAVKNGAHLMTGGYVPDELNGAFYPPTILTEVGPDNPVYSEELFGPVAMVFKAADEYEALSLANDSPFGLGAAIFSKDEEKAWELAEDHLEAGSCFINGQVRSDPRLPFGGIKQSGYGRELSHFGIKEFTNIKTVYKA